MTKTSIEQQHRKKFLDDYNASLPQIKWWSDEFEEYIVSAEGGIGDSHYMNFVYDNIRTTRIEELLLKRFLTKEEWKNIKKRI
tara:strand:- start:188 stop:436 length:249 start_codon:yes stop_codon:yes gene_type:complete